MPVPEKPPTSLDDPGLPPSELFTPGGLVAADSVPSAPASRSGLSATVDDPPTRVVIPDAPVIPGYDVEGVLGRGGMGVVYKARQRKPNRLVALKVLLAGAAAGEQELARFRAEGEAIARLNHPHVVQVYQVGDYLPPGGVDPLPFFSLELVEGGSLAARLAGTPLKPEEAARLVEVLARTMQAAHSAGIIHRDLKPHNVLLASGASLPRQWGEQPPVDAQTVGSRPPLAGSMPKITDFGLAKKVEGGSDLTQTGAVLGTPSYLAPEQAEGKKDVGPAADVYALGAILYECLTGRPPFRGANVLDTLEQVRKQEPVSPRALNVKVPRDLETVTLKCLAKAPRARYASALDLAEDLQRFHQGVPVLARPIGAIGRLVKWCRRNPTVATLTAALFLALVLGLAGTTWKWREAVQANDNYKAERDRANRETDAANDRGTNAVETLKSVVYDVYGLTPDTPENRKLREGLLRTTRKQIEKLAASIPASTDLDHTQFLVYLELGSLFLNSGVGDTDEGRALYDLAVRAARKRLEANPDDVGARKDVAIALSNLCNAVLRQGRNDEAATVSEEATTICRGLLSGHSDDPIVRRTLSRCLHAQASTAHLNGRLVDALQSAEEEIATLQALLDGKQLDNGLRQDLAMACEMAGTLALEAAQPHKGVKYLLRANRLNQEILKTPPLRESAVYHLAAVSSVLASACWQLAWPQAESYADNARVFLEGLLVSDPGNPGYKITLSSALLTLMNVKLQQGKFADARKAAESWRRLADQLAQADRSNVHLQIEAANSRLCLGLVAHWQGKLDEAREHLGEARDALQRLEAAGRLEGQALGQALLASANARLAGLQGNHAEMARTAERLAQCKNVSWYASFHAASAYGLALRALRADKPESDLAADQRTLAMRYAARAVELLRQAADAGLLNAAFVRRAPELEVLRDREDFRRLLDSIQTRARAQVK